MVKKLRYSKIDLIERAGALMLVSFLDDDGNMYQWAPKWSQVEEIFLKQINVERFNKPESEWLNRFAKTTQSVVEGAQRIEGAYKAYGKFTRYENQQLILDEYRHMLTPGFEVTLDFLDNWLKCDVEAFVVNDVVIRLRSLGDFGAVLTEYPPPEKESDELPF